MFKLLAKGVEVAAEGEYCRQIGIDLMQGFFMDNQVITSITPPNRHRVANFNLLNFLILILFL